MTTELVLEGVIADPAMRFSFVVEGGAVTKFGFEQNGGRFKALRRPS